MKKLTNIVEYGVKGELVSLEENIITSQVIKKDETIEDSVDFNELLASVQTFCDENLGKEIEMKFSIKVVQE